MFYSFPLALVVYFSLATSYAAALRCHSCDSLKANCTDELTRILDCSQLDPTFDSCITMTAKLLNQTSSGNIYTEVTIRNCTKRDLCGENAVGCYPLKNQHLAGCHQSCCVTDECNRPDTKENPTSTGTISPDITTVQGPGNGESPNVTTQPAMPKVEAGRNASAKPNCYPLPLGFVFFVSMVTQMEKFLLPD